jgi:hypothetical protein
VCGPAAVGVDARAVTAAAAAAARQLRHSRRRPLPVAARVICAAQRVSGAAVVVVAIFRATLFLAHVWQWMKELFTLEVVRAKRHGIAALGVAALEQAPARCSRGVFAEVAAVALVSFFFCVETTMLVEIRRDLKRKTRWKAK